MKFVLSILFVAITLSGSAQSAKKQAEIESWASIVSREVNWDYMVKLQDLCAFYHDGIYKGKVYPKYKNQEPDYFVAKLHASTGCNICSYYMGFALTHAKESIDKYNNYTSGMVQLKKSAESGYKPAIWALANIYANPNTKDIDQAKKYLNALVQAGDTAAVATLKRIDESEHNPFELGEAAYARKDYTEALRLWSIDYQQNKNGVAARNIGLMYYNGTGFAKDIEKAHEYFGYGYTLEDAVSIYYCGKIWYDKGVYTYAADIWEHAKKYGYQVAQADLDFVIAEREKERISNQQKYDEFMAEKKAQQAIEDAREAKRKDAAANNTNYGINSNRPNGTEAPNKSAATAHVCPFCKGTGVSASASYKSMEQDKNGRWYNVYNPGRTTSCAYCKGKGTL